MHGFWNFAHEYRHTLIEKGGFANSSTGLKQSTCISFYFLNCDALYK